MGSIQSEVVPVPKVTCRQIELLTLRPCSLTQSSPFLTAAFHQRKKRSYKAKNAKAKANFSLSKIACENLMKKKIYFAFYIKIFSSLFNHNLRKVETYF